MKVQITSLVLFVLMLSNCGNEHLVKNKRIQEALALPESPLVSALIDFCTMAPDTFRSKLKFTFVMDKSGSNEDPGTDFDGSRRYAPLVSFLENAEKDESIYYSLVNFSSSNTTKLHSGYTNDNEKFLDIVNKEWDPDLNSSNGTKPNDGGWTDMLSALQRVHDLIEADIKAEKLNTTINSSFYIVILVSDGAPYIGDDELQDLNDILTAVKGIKSFEAGNKSYVDAIQLNTGYYFTTVPDPTTEAPEYAKHLEAENYMVKMAEKGDGANYKFGAGQVIDFSKFAVPERKVKHKLRDIIVTNKNVVWHDGQMRSDADADNLPDYLEKELGSDPKKADSDENGVSDGVEYFVSDGKPCKDKNCDPKKAEGFESCSSFVDDTKPGRTMLDSDGDGLNDCEERIVLKSNEKSFDSNEDWIPDALSFKKKIAFIEGTKENTHDPDNDGEQNYSEIKLNTPLKIPNNKIKGLVPYKYALTPKSEDINQTCYQLHVEDITALNVEDSLQIFLMENTAVIDEKRFMRIAEKKVGRLDAEVKFDADDFK